MKTETCVSMNCPFIMLCKHYRIDARHENGCGHQEEMLSAAKRLTKMREMRAKHPDWTMPDIMFALQKKG